MLVPNEFNYGRHTIIFESNIYTISCWLVLLNGTRTLIKTKRSLIFKDVLSDALDYLDTIGKVF